MAQAKELTLFGEVEFEGKAPDGFPLSCPTLDLSTTWDSSGRDLLIYRPPKQVISRIHQAGAPGQKAPEVVALRWKCDGQFLAVGWSDGFVRLMGLENNKPAHHLNIRGQTTNDITYIGWATVSISDRSSELASDSFKNLFPEEDGFEDAPKPFDLPREIEFFDIQSQLPKLSPLPSGSVGSGEDAMVFTLRSGMETLFQPLIREDYERLNIMVVGTSDGKLHLSICDSFIVGALECPKSDSNQPLQLICQASDPQVSTQALLLADKIKEPEEVNIVPLALPFTSASPLNQSLLAHELTTLQKLLRYVRQTQLHMQVEWKNSKELPARFIRSVNGELEQSEKGPKDIVTALYHTLLTGDVHKPVREWFVETLSERGHKRWDKAVIGGLEGLRSLVHQYFMPALERCSAILGRLEAWANHFDDLEDTDLGVPKIRRTLDALACLVSTAWKILKAVIRELERFNSFSTWIRLTIDRLTSPRSEEITEKQATLDHSKVISYIKSYLTNSPLNHFFDEIDKEDYAKDWEVVENEPNLQDLAKKEIRIFLNDTPNMKAFPHVEFLVDYMTAAADRMFAGIANEQRKGIRFGVPSRLTLGRPISKVEMKMCKTPSGKIGRVLTALTLKDANQVYIFSSHVQATARPPRKMKRQRQVPELDHSLENSKLKISGAILKELQELEAQLIAEHLKDAKGRPLFNKDCDREDNEDDDPLPVPPPIKSCCIDIGSRKLVGFNFLDDEALIMLCTETDGSTKALSVPVRSNKVTYAIYNPGNFDDIPRVSADNFTVLSFPEGHAVKPLRMEVHERRDVRGEIPARICLLEGNRTILRAYVIPT